GLLVLSRGDLLARSWTPLGSGSGSLILFPLFTGLFGLSTLFISLKDNSVMPEQSIDDGPIDLERWRRLRGIFSGTAAGALVGWFPGITAGAATPIAKAFSGGDETDEKDSKEYIIAVAAVGTSCSIFVVVALFVIFKARSGAMMAVLQLGGEMVTSWEPLGAVPVFLALMLFSILLASLFSTYLTLYFGSLFGRVLSRFSYSRICIGIISFLFIMIFLLTGPFGILLALLSTCVGLIPPLIGVTRVHLMGCLLFPIILFYLGWSDAILAYLGVI
ncbi:MAG: tripartite tricarboxylate transporter permease, partial [Thermoplasmata archaeon]|nr:tripartite tricarboxylate transporter permease [Thermoplasmata archaeon]